MTLLAAGSALVAGSGAEESKLKTLRIRVLRAFYIEGKRQEVKAVITVPAVFATEMIAANKAERVESEAPAASAPTAGAQSQVKGKSDAGK